MEASYPTSIWACDSARLAASAARHWIQQTTANREAVQTFCCALARLEKPVDSGCDMVAELVALGLDVALGLLVEFHRSAILPKI